MPAYLIKATVRGIMSQRLVRILCPSCKTFTPLDLDAWRELTLPWQMEPPRADRAPGGLQTLSRHRLHGPPGHL